MKKPEPTYQKMDVPRLDAEVKNMNGKSTKRLHQCIDALDDVLEDAESVSHCPAEPPKED